jgi:hypothetical protein
MSLSSRKRRCGIQGPLAAREAPKDLSPAHPTALRQLAGRQRQALNSQKCMAITRGVLPTTKARRLLTGRAEPHARIHRLHNFLGSDRTLRRRTSGGFFRDIFVGDCHRTASGAARAATHRPITSRRMASPSVEQPFYWSRQAHPSLIWQPCVKV